MRAPTAIHYVSSFRRSHDERPSLEDCCNESRDLGMRHARTSSREAARGTSLESAERFDDDACAHEHERAAIWRLAVCFHGPAFLGPISRRLLASRPGVRSQRWHVTFRHQPALRLNSDHRVGSSQNSRGRREFHQLIPSCARDRAARQPWPTPPLSDDKVLSQARSDGQRNRNALTLHQPLLESIYPEKEPS
jgi:hypothetical protein